MCVCISNGNVFTQTQRDTRGRHANGCVIYHNGVQCTWLHCVVAAVPSDEPSPPCPTAHRLVGLVAKASASRAEDPGFESHLRGNFFGVESCQ